MTSARCADVSAAVGEPISATAITATTWLLVEVRGAWPRDVADEGGLAPEAQASVAAWLEQHQPSRLLFIRRAGRAGEPRLAFVVRATETTADVRQIDVDEAGGLAGVDLASDGVVVGRQLVLVCAHGTRDACCALRGNAVFGTLAAHLSADELWLSSHQGGHRFAANVLVLPSGIQLGRVSPGNSARIVGDALSGTIALDHYRGRTAYTRREQAAEQVIRESYGLVDVGGLTLVADNGTHVRFVDAEGREHRPVPEELAGPAVPASCGTEAEPQPHLAARLV